MYSLLSYGRRERPARYAGSICSGWKCYVCSGEGEEREERGENGDSL